VFPLTLAAILVVAGLVVAWTPQRAVGQTRNNRRSAAGAPFQDFAPPRQVDEARASAAGIRKLTSQHLILYTDLLSDPAVDRLPAVFDQAVPQWAEYFGINPAKTRNWEAQGFLISDRRKFDALGLMPAGNDQFEHGISKGREFWLHDQPTPYYRQHLLLHEGTHVFMVSFLGACGPGWFMEGTAELLGTHRYDDRYDRLTLRMMPQNREEVPMLGRIKLIHDALAADRALGLPAVMKIDNREKLGNESYAWCWAAAKFLDSHPRYRDRFRQLRRHVRDADFDDVVRRELADDWDDLLAEWLAFVATLEYGYDFERMAIDFDRGQPLGGAPHRVTVAADRGWQSSGVRLMAGRSYRTTAAGRYEIANDGQPWPCEPGGVTIDYHDGRPLGMLLGAIDGRAGDATLANAFEIGLGTTITPTASGTLYLRVNDWPGQLDDNRGTLTVTIDEAKTALAEPVAHGTNAP
jgi:hypothetical protein